MAGLRRSDQKPPVRAGSWAFPASVLARLERPTPRVTSISAPVGSGVSRLIETWLARQPHRPWAWVSFAAADATPTDPHAPPAAPLVPAELTAALDWVSARAAGRLVLSGIEQLEPSVLSAILDQVIHRLPATGRLILTDTGFGLAPDDAVRLAGEVDELGPTELWWSPAMMTSQITRLLGLTPADPQIDRIAELTGGWPASVLILARLARQRPDALLRPAAEATDAGLAAIPEILDYLTGRVLAGLPVATRRFVLRTSVLTELDPGTCAALVPEANPHALLAELHRRGLTVQTPSGHQAGRPAIRAAALRALRAEDSGAEARLQRAAAGYARRHGRLPAAITGLVGCEDWADAFDLLRTSADAGFPGWAPLDLHRIVLALPAPTWADDPGRRVLVAWTAAMSGDQLLAADVLRRPPPAAAAGPALPTAKPAVPATKPAVPATERSVPTTERSVPTTAHAAPTVEWAAPTVERSAPSVESAVPSAEPAVSARPAVLAVVPAAPSWPDVTADLVRALGIAVSGSARPAQQAARRARTALADLESAFPAMEFVGLPEVGRLTALADLLAARAALLDDDLTAVQAHLDVLRRDDAGRLPRYLQLAALGTEALAATRSGELNAGQRSAARAQQLAEQAGLTRHAFLVPALLARVDLLAARGRTTEALSELDDVERLAEQSEPFVPATCGAQPFTALAKLTRAHLLLDRAEVDAARAALEEAAGHLTPDPPPAVRTADLTARARLDLLTAEPAAAQRRLAETTFGPGTTTPLVLHLRIAAALQRQIPAVAAQLLAGWPTDPGMNSADGHLRRLLARAAVALALDRRSEAGDSLDAALAAAETDGRIEVFLDQPAAARGLTATLLKRRPAGSPWSQELLRRLEEPLALPDAGAPSITQRERVVLEYLAGSLTHAQIAAALFVSENTLKSHCRNLYRKLAVNSQAEAVRIGRARGWLEPAPAQDAVVLDLQADTSDLSRT